MSSTTFKESFEAYAAAVKQYIDTQSDLSLSLKVFDGKKYGVVGGVGIDESDNIGAAIEACGQAGGGMVVIKAVVPTDPIYINKSIQIEYNNVCLVYASPLLYGPDAFQRINGGMAEMMRTELGQTELIKLRADATTDAIGRMVLPLRTGDGTYLKVGDRITVRGQNDKFGNAIQKQVTTVIELVGDTATCADEPEETFKAVYPTSEWPSDWTTGTTISISVYSQMTTDGLPNTYTVNVVDSTPFQLGDLVYVSDSRTETDMMAPATTTLRSAANMEITRVVGKTPTTLTFDRALRRNHLVTYDACVIKLDAIYNSHIVTREISWTAPQPSRKNSILAVNYGDSCTISCKRMDGRAGRYGIGIRLGYAYNCHVRYSELRDAYSYNSAEGYGIAMYYSTLCKVENCIVSGCRHNYLLQTTTSCDVINNTSSDDYISGIDLHGANSVNSRIMHNRVSRSSNYAPGVTNGGGIRNGNTSHCIGDHDTLIEDNYIEGYVGDRCSAIDVSPSSRDVIIKDNTIVDSSIGVRHYKVGSTIDVNQHSNRITIENNDFYRIAIKPLDIANYANSYWDEVILTGNSLFSSAMGFSIQDVPKVTAIGNRVFSPSAAPAGGYAFEFTNIADLKAHSNYTQGTARGINVTDCTMARVTRNLLADTLESIPVNDGGGNTTLIQGSNTDSTAGDTTAIESTANQALTTAQNAESMATTNQQNLANVTTRVTTLEQSIVPNVPQTFYITAFGDSRTAQNWVYTYNQPTPLARGWLWWAETLSSRVRLDHRYNQGVSGDDVSELRARIENNTLNAYGFGPADVPIGPAVLHIGTNSISSLATKAEVDAVLVNYDWIVNWLLTRGHKLMLICEWPRFGLTADEQKCMYYYAEQIRQYRNRPNLWVVDVWQRVADPAAVDCSPLPNMLDPDGLHNSPGVSYITGKAIAQCLAEMGFPKIQMRPSSNGDIYDAALNPEGCLNTNPMLVQGAGGTLGTGVTGVTPEGWKVSVSTGVTADCSFVDVVVNGEKRKAFRIVASGTPTATNGYVQFRQTGLHTKIAAGDILEAGCECYVNDGHVNFSAPCVQIDPGVSAEKAMGGLSITGDSQMPASAVEGYYAQPRTNRYTVPATLPTTLALDLRPFFTAANVSSSVTIDFLSAWCRKV